MATIPTLAEAKAYMRIDPDYTLEDDLIIQMLAASVDWCEKYTGLSFTVKQFTHYSPRPYFDLQFYPLVEIISVQDSNAADISWELSSAYYPKVIPAYGGVVVTYTAGYANDLPDNLKLAVLMFANTMYENREDFVISNFRTFANELPISVKDLLGLHTRNAGLFL